MDSIINTVKGSLAVYPTWYLVVFVLVVCFIVVGMVKKATKLMFTAMIVLFALVLLGVIPNSLIETGVDKVKEKLEVPSITQIETQNGVVK